MSERRQTMAELGQVIRDARRSRGWSQAELRERAQVSRPTVARIESGDDVNTGTLVKVTEALGVSRELRPRATRELGAAELR
ncbi:XRE family transcriptional regulator [Arthrobacter frigidicola]|nr:XRE family transcriptional regulator [Arthrobacter frigidicola]